MPDPTSQIVLYGYHYSVYLRIVRMTMLEKGVGWTHVEIDPFAKVIPADYLALHPFGRVPTLKHNDFVLYEPPLSPATWTRRLPDRVCNRAGRKSGRG